MVRYHNPRRGNTTRRASCVLQGIKISPDFTATKPASAYLTDRNPKVVQKFQIPNKISKKNVKIRSADPIFYCIPFCCGALPLFIGSLSPFRGKLRAAFTTLSFRGAVAGRDVGIHYCFSGERSSRRAFRPPQDDTQECHSEERPQGATRESVV